MPIKIPIISDNIEIRKLIEKKNAYDIVYYIRHNYKKISKNNLALLANALVDSERANYINELLFMNLKGLDITSISNILIKGLIDSGDNYRIKVAALEDNISDDNRRLLIDFLIKTECEYLYEVFLSSKCPLDKKEEIINQIIEIEDNTQMYYLIKSKSVGVNLEKKFMDILIKNEKYEHIKGLYENLHDEKTKEEAFKAFENSSKATVIYDFAQNIEISEEQKERLTNSIIKTKNAEYIYKFIKNVIKDNYINPRYELLLEETILKSKDLIYIANYIYLKRDKSLLEEIFGDFYKFIDYCYLNERDLDFNLRNLNAWIGEESYRYVDNNIDNYLSRNCFKISKGGK